MPSASMIVRSLFVTRTSSPRKRMRIPGVTFLMVCARVSVSKMGIIYWLVKWTTVKVIIGKIVRGDRKIFEQEVLG